MTPMIDVTFLLIIFFMIITDLTQQDLEELKLPVAVQSVARRAGPDEGRAARDQRALQTRSIIVKREHLLRPGDGRHHPARALPGRPGRVHDARRSDVGVPEPRGRSPGHKLPGQPPPRSAPTRTLEFKFDPADHGDLRQGGHPASGRSSWRPPRTPTRRKRTRRSKSMSMPQARSPRRSSTWR